MQENNTVLTPPETLADIASVEAMGAAGRAALLALANNVYATGASTLVPAASYGTAFSAPAITPKLSGKFLIFAGIGSHPTAGTLTACVSRIFDGTGLATGAPNNVPVPGIVGADTPAANDIGHTLVAKVTGYTIGTPVTFSLQMNPTGDSVAVGVAYILVVELPQ